MDKRDVGRRNVEWSLHLLTFLAEVGVKHVVISPGSRSTPLVLAASAIDSLTKHIILDERSAAFFALGLAKITGIPAVLICTSGTAAANYFPAVIEASQSYTPLIVISADRPKHLQNRHAPQTINQEYLFGKYALFYKNLEQLLKDGNYEQTRYCAYNAFQTAFDERGPVHLNTPFSKPLEPSSAEFKEILTNLSETKRTSILNPVTKNDVSEDQTLFQPVWDKLAVCKRPLIVAGPSTVLNGTEEKLLKSLVENGSIPILGEAVSGVKSFGFTTQKNGIISGFETFLRDKTIVKSLKPDFILRVGLPPVSIALSNYLLSHKECEQWSVSHARQLPDPDFTVSHFINVPFNIQSFEPAPPETHVNDKWLSDWKANEHKVRTVLDDVLREPNSLTDGNAIHNIVNRIPEKSNLFISNSLSVRDLDLFTIGSLPPSTILHNRGASGIDGNTSTAAGMASASNRESWLITGDLAFLHDTTSLLTLSAKNQPKFTICIMNNGGGTIFRMLPVYEHKDIYTPFFETPQHAVIGTICSGFGVLHKRVTNTKELTTILAQRATEKSGVLVIECITNADESLMQRKSLWNHH